MFNSTIAELPSFTKLNVELCSSLRGSLEFYPESYEASHSYTFVDCKPETVDDFENKDFALHFHQRLIDGRLTAGLQTQIVTKALRLRGFTEVTKKDLSFPNVCLAIGLDEYQASQLFYNTSDAYDLWKKWDIIPSTAFKFTDLTVDNVKNILGLLTDEDLSFFWYPYQKLDGPKIVATHKQMRLFYEKWPRIKYILSMVRDTLVATPQNNFDMRSWGSPELCNRFNVKWEEESVNTIKEALDGILKYQESEESCNTVGCIAGWITYLCLKHPLLAQDRGRSDRVEDEAFCFLGVEEDGYHQASKFFRDLFYAERSTYYSTIWDAATDFYTHESNQDAFPHWGILEDQLPSSAMRNSITKQHAIDMIDFILEHVTFLDFQNNREKLCLSSQADLICRTTEQTV